MRRTKERQRGMDSIAVSRRPHEGWSGALVTMWVSVAIYSEKTRKPLQHDKPIARSISELAAVNTTVYQ